MKILISLSRTKEDSWYFRDRALDYGFGQNTLSRETVIYMSPSDFLKLASPGREQEKLDNVRSVLEQGHQLEDIPYLGVETDKDDNIYVANNGNDHEGRHRMMALQELNVSKVPVKIVSKPYGEGYAFRWGQTKRRPKTLTGYNGFKIKFPNIETYPL